MPAYLLLFFLCVANTVALAQHDHARHEAAPLGTQDLQDFQDFQDFQDSQEPRNSSRRGPPAGTPAWTTQPLLLPERGGSGRRDERGGGWLRPQGLNAAELEVFGPAGGVRRFPVGPGGARIESETSDTGNYHWVVARENDGETVKTASTAWYFSNPGPSPARLLEQLADELVIVPDPLPREHGVYRESEKWRFIVRFRGQALPYQKLLMETEAGTRTVFETDGAGIATVLFPRDLAARAVAGGHGRERVAFVLSTRTTAEGKNYLSAFNQVYSPDADRGRSLAWGAFFGLGGMLCAVPLLRRRQTLAANTANDSGE